MARSSSDARRSSSKAVAALRLAAATTVSRADMALNGLYRRLSARILLRWP